MKERMMKTALLLAIGLGLGVAVADASAAKLKGITTMAELADYAAQNGNNIKMKPGVYQMSDLLTEDGIEQRLEYAKARAEKITSKRLEAAMLLFSGHHNQFDLTGVTIEVDTKFLSAFKGSYMIELMITGRGNSFKGLTLTDIGNEPTSKGGTSLAVYGDDTLLKEVTLNVRGSSPYGYGDLLGKGKGSSVRLQKHSGLLVCGANTQLLGCRVISRSMGHCFFIQGGRNTYFEDCYAEGEMRQTDDMLAETSGLAFENNFRTVYKPNVIQPGYMKSLQECGFRTYGKGGPEQQMTGKVTLVNCTAKHVRVGFALDANADTDPVDLKNCTALGCERGFYLNKAHAVECRGDAMYGPLMYLKGEEASVIDLTLLPDTSDRIVHAVATLCGSGHTVSIKGTRGQLHPIMLGYGSPPAGEISVPIPESPAEGIKLTNETMMPVWVSQKAVDCTVMSRAPVQNDGDDVTVVVLPPVQQK
jgi:hypothetical protein